MWFSLDHLRTRLADVDAIPQLAIIGIVSGLFSGGLVILFRLTVELPQMWVLPGHEQENYEGLALEYRIGLPIAGALILALAYKLIKPEAHSVGVVHVLNRLHNHQGWFDLRNALVQFFAGALSLFSGHSLGREGPAVHLGSAASSLLGQWLRLPNNSIRTLVGCGTAAAISASFNTPIAGVVFAMEVIMMEYTKVTFTPVILASVTGAVMSRAVFGDAPSFSVPPLTMNSLYELPFLVVMGFVVGVLAAAFIWLTRWMHNISQPYPIWQRIILAGCITALLAIFFPQVMGVGYDTVNAALLGQLSLWLLLSVVVAKLLATSACVGFGMPGGLIGPMFVMGSCLGGAMGLLGHNSMPEISASAGFYAMLGMAAMMSACLQAPLAGLMALLELTANPNIILPGMLVVVIANLVATELFKQKSIVVTMLNAQGLDYRSDPLSQYLYRVGVQSVMDRRFIRHGNRITFHEAEVLLENGPHWLMIDRDDVPVAIMPMADLDRYMQEYRALPEEERPDDEESFSLLAIPADRKDLADIELRSTLKEALDQLNHRHVDALYIHRMTAPLIRRVYGIITRKDIERYYSKLNQ